MSLFGKLFGGGGAKAPATVTHEGFRITPQPVAEGGQFRLGALIELEGDGERRSHTMIRADLFPSRLEAEEAAIRKAKLLIDQQGTKLFG